MLETEYCGVKEDEVTKDNLEYSPEDNNFNTP